MRGSIARAVPMRAAVHTGAFTQRASRSSSRLVVIGGLALIIGLASCGHGPRTTVLSTTDPADYPCVLHDPKTLGPDFMVRQTITIRAQRDGEPVEGQLDAVLQKQGDTLLLMGFGPMNVKAFTLTQRGDRIEATQHIGPELPFSPRDIVVDVHRVLFKRLPAPPDAEHTGVVRGELDGEHVEETWQAGEVRARVFTRPTSALHGAVRVDLGPGCKPAHCEPESATLHNEWFGYTLTMTSEAYEPL
jgi:hypothetical protein